MVFRQQFIERIDQLIRLRATGSPQEFAEKLEISERQVYRLITHLKEIGCPVVYDKSLCSYKYEVEGELKFEFCPKLNKNNTAQTIDKTDMRNIKGGFCENTLLTDRRWQWGHLCLWSEYSQNV